jgi:hypothetical protein
MAIGAFMAAGGTTFVAPNIWVVLWPFLMALLIFAVVRAVRSRKKARKD